MKIFLTILCSLGVAWNVLYIAVNVNRLSVFQLIWAAVIIITCAINLYFLWNKKTRVRVGSCFHVLSENRLYIVPKKENELFIY